MATDKERFISAKAYLKQGDTESARRLLKQIDHPAAKKLLSTLPPEKFDYAKWLIIGMAIIGIIGFMVMAIDKYQFDQRISDNVAATATARAQ